MDGSARDLTPPATDTHEWILTLSCPDQPGTVFEVSRFLLQHRCTIVESQQFSDAEIGRFFMRVQFRHTGPDTLDGRALRQDFNAVADAAMMNWRLTSRADKQRVLIMVSRYGHCLNDLLYRTSSGALDLVVPAIVSNHADLKGMADNFGVAFHHIPVTTASKPEAEAQLLELVDTLDVDLVVLARYMQILSTDLCQKLEGRAINIHHSMLPSFKGARPYHQAYDRGVKLVGATAHYVTSDLDEGPIIEQEVTRVDHTFSAEAVAALGRDNECRALSRAVGWHTQNRILLDGGRTVVFS
ncbi:Formyltetrahydrofolate deformylase (plasmid) [Rhodococcus opacus]|uniref:Formyltetrahydrofolate deformylase n=1 Tax=Rhodococcus opacus TaxID=37919 RepID=A0A1B1KIK6_RHOOP|nr:formyltetrahydrofolate deformylase [Rhodococcus opacus]ANS32332.1 Formyltetrahydrofolate deformylase [Rhodococcus opacus]ANS32424.1 Formyltetrahydrofolate deformylase [Rhodococcus opacus]